MNNLTNAAKVMISLGVLLFFTASQSSSSPIVENNPFYSMNDTKIHSINGLTSDGKLLVDLKYSPELTKRGGLTFFMINLFNNNNDKQTRTLHADCDLIVLRDKIELFRASTQYGEPIIHAPDGIMLSSFAFNQTGKYTLSVEVGGLNFFPIKPVFANFSAIVTPTDGNLKIKLSA